MTKALATLSITALIALGALTSSPLQAKVKLHSIGDSTMQTYDESSTDKRGWCQMLQQFFDSDFIQVNNRGKSGASSKSFYLESAYWPTMVAQTSTSTTIEEGDYVIIQFAHNDEKNGGADGDTVKAYYNYIGDAATASTTDYRGTTAYGTFKGFIRAFIDETKARGGKPIIVTPICRKYFSGTSAIRRNGRHDLGDSFTICDGQTLTTGHSVAASDHTYDYTQSLIDVAAEYEDVPVIDLTQLTADMYVSYGEAFCTANLFCTDDSTHPASMGATLIARAFAQAVKNGDNQITKAQNYDASHKAQSDAILTELAEHVIVSNEISFNPQSGDLGRAYSGQTLTKEFNVSAFGLAQESGTVTFQTTGDFLVSTDKQQFATTAQADYTGSTLITTIYVQATLSGTGTITGTLTASDGEHQKTLDLSAEVISLSGDTEECSVLWAMNGGNAAVTEGAIQALDQRWSEMYAKDYNNINKAAIWPEESGYDASRKTQRNCIVGDAWPAGEIDEVSTRYIQLGVKAPEQTVINVDRISMYLAGAGGSGMRCKVYYSLDSLFSAPVQIAEFTSMAGNTAYLVSQEVVESIEDGQELYLRIYPWYNGAATGKSIALADVCIHGWASSADQSVTIEGSTVTWPFHSGTDDQEPEYDPFEASAYFTSPAIVVGEKVAFHGTATWSGSTEEGNVDPANGTVMTQVGNPSTTDSFTSGYSDDQGIILETHLTNGGVFIPSGISLDAARLGTDGGAFSVIVCAGNDEQEIISGQTPNRSGKGLFLSHYDANVNGLAADEDNPLRIKILLGNSLGKGKYYAFANIQVQGTVMGAGDDSKLTVQSISPESGVGVSRTGKVVINYSARIAQGEGEVTLTHQTTSVAIPLTPVWSNRAITLPYIGLDYGTTYRLHVPEGYVVDAATGQKAAPAVDYDLSVIERPVPTARSFDAIVDGSLTQLEYLGKIEATATMPAQYRTIQAAIDDAPASSTQPYLIYIKEGYYRDPNFSFNSGYGTAYVDRTPTSTDTETTRISGAINEYDSCRIICINKPNIHLIGQERDKVIIATDRFDGAMNNAKMTDDPSHHDHSRVWYHISAGATVEVQDKGTDFYMEGITVDNENWTQLHLEGPQSLCFNISGDRAVLHNVRTRSYQDTYYNGGTYNRTFWYDSEIEGSVDFIYGASDVFFEGCTLNINRSSGGYIVAPNHPKETRWGYVFNNTRITTDDVADPSRYSIWLGRPWHEYPKTVFLHTQMELTPMDSLWYQTMGGLPDLWAVYDMWNVKGNPLSTVSRKCYYYTDSEGNKVWGVAKNELSDEEAAQYTITNVFSGDGSTNASGYWNPQAYVDKPAVPELHAVGTEVTWTADRYAICYVVTVNGKPVAFPTECSYSASAGDVVTVQSVGEHGTLSDASLAVTISSDGISTLQVDDVATQRTYDLLGRPISGTSSVHGLLLQNGRKFLR